MRILLDYRPALRQRTGVGEYVHELSRALLATTHGRNEAITLFSASWKDRLPADTLPGASIADCRVPNRLLNLLWHRLGWPPVDRLAGRSFDVVQSLHPLLMPARNAARLVTIHDLDFLDHPERTAREIRRDYRALAPVHARRADHVVVNSAWTGAAVRERLAVPSDRLTVCYPGAPAWTPRTAEPDSGCVLFVGTLEPRKNLGVLLDAYRRLLARHPGAPRLVLAGRPGQAFSLLRAHAADRPLAGHVDFPGYVPDAGREALFKRALLFVMPSHTEGFGMPVVEAMTAGVPVVATNRGALPEVAGDAAAYFEPDDAEGLEHLIADLLANAERRQAMRERGWAQAARFTWRQSAEVLRGAWVKARAAFEARRG